MGKTLFRIRQDNPLIAISGSGLADQIIDPAVTSKTQSILIARGGIVLLRFRRLAQSQRATGLAKPEFRKTVIDMSCLLKGPGRFVHPSLVLGRDPLFIKRVPVFCVGLRQTRPMGGSKGSAIH